MCNSKNQSMKKQRKKIKQFSTTEFTAMERKFNCIVTDSFIFPFCILSFFKFPVICFKTFRVTNTHHFFGIYWFLTIWRRNINNNKISKKKKMWKCSLNVHPSNPIYLPVDTYYIVSSHFYLILFSFYAHTKTDFIAYIQGRN